MPDQLDQFTSAKTGSRPVIYAYADPRYPGLLKVGFTSRPVAERMAEHYPTLAPDGKKPYRVVFCQSAMYSDGGSFTDHAVHKMLKKRGIANPNGEWFRCQKEDVAAAWLAVATRSENEENRDRNFAMRPEQKAAVDKTAAWFRKAAKEGRQGPKFLWNAKMRFGKTFAAYQLARRMNLSRVLILTFKPAVQSAWAEDLARHADFAGWQFISAQASQLTLDQQYERADKSRPIVCFGSFQDFLGVNRDTGGIKPKNEWVHAINWDLVIFDEYHFGAWKDSAKKLFEEPDEESEADADAPNPANCLNESWLPITSKRYLYLSGTPFRALNSGEFIEDQIYNWTYADEQRAKAAWQGPDNPYAALPRLALLTYRLPDAIRGIAQEGEFNEFDLNVFFSASGKGKNAQFIYEDYVQKWLDLIRGAYLPASKEDLKLGRGRPAMPFADSRLLQSLSHTLWFLPNVAACEAMANLLKKRQNSFYHDFKINVCAGPGAGIGLAALAPVLASMDNPLESRTITLSCGKLTTGVTVKPWTGVFMLRNLASPETYFQTAFRAQSPWEIAADNCETEIVKHECYVFDFAPERALRQIADYSCRLNVEERNPEKKVEEFIDFLPVIAYDGATMRQIDAKEILDFALAGTSATLLARRWESALLVNVDNDTLRRLLDNEDAMAALDKIEGFRSLNADLEFIINKSEEVKQARKEQEKPDPEQKRKLDEAEKEFRKKRKAIQEKLIRFATRIPVFMYLSDYREFCLRDVITKLEPALFKKVTGLTVSDFELLCSLDLFNGALMNDAVYKFKRYEDASLCYAGIESPLGQDNVGLFDTVLTEEEYRRMHESQQASLN